ncbi:RimK family protein [Salinibius halmophilus]|uniref:RimK family protein n=1 Tax=Salinibius halmophilus TaxID=1853216 RepID=UPI000E6690CF|nr:RimK family protein [Salinibius halmophilus]
MHKTLIVTDTENVPESLQHSVLNFATYLKAYPKKDEPSTKVINLCDTEHYLSQGYYCSLLAEARQHKVMPSLKVINSLRKSADESPTTLDVTALAVPQTSSEPVYVFFGEPDAGDAKVSQAVFQKFPAPLLKWQWVSEPDSPVKKVSVRRVSMNELSAEQSERFWQRLEAFTAKTWPTHSQRKPMRWEMAILVDPAEQDPPSDAKALKAFVKAARKMSINASLVTPDNLADLSRFDALFVRQTTAIDHPTYRTVIAAENEGLVVIDDSQSILRCCNKVFLHDAFSYQNVPTPKTQILHEIKPDTLAELEATFGFPMVLKLPEGAFSRGVYKANNAEELAKHLNDMFSVSALVLVQEYMYTEFDWRIGVLNGRALYACRYEMARNHWQIYNHKVKRGNSGGFKTLPTFEVPKSVLDVAIRACNVIGKSLYGVDIKVKNGKPYVLEVNDNPSIEHHVEDAYLGNELYMQIMAEFQQRLEARGKQ